MIKTRSIKAWHRGFAWGARSQGLGAARTRLSQHIPADLPAGQAAPGRASTIPTPHQRLPCLAVKCPLPAAGIGRQPEPAHRRRRFTSSKRNREVFVGGGYKALNCVGEQSFQLLKLASLEPEAAPAWMQSSDAPRLLGPSQGQWGLLSATSR